ncbi:Aste57867_12166 [Aphanomyces stellatus]|uniref:Aste57867_12166 protein n=1 Tax=Aphanomyces stellatus TaxID=120398 RepID=A0A485KVG0_9STRA|nr:hypothetical protein As57867_012121 [Aphanomyces stellatus]VFT89020.1 Aste57867_12166 [Aphanomyces stellatus]
MASEASSSIVDTTDTSTLVDPTTPSMQEKKKTHATETANAATTARETAATTSPPKPVAQVTAPAPAPTTTPAVADVRLTKTHQEVDVTALEEKKRKADTTTTAVDAAVAAGHIEKKRKDVAPPKPAATAVQPSEQQQTPSPAPVDPATPGPKTPGESRGESPSTEMTVVDLKAAQRRSMKAIRQIAHTEMEALEPDMPEETRREIAGVLQAHVNELCSSTFTYLVRNYFPTATYAPKKDESPIDPKTLARIKDLESQILAKEASIQAHQTKMPATIREIMQAKFAAKAKPLEEAAAAAALSHPCSTTNGIEYSAADIADLKATFERIAAKIDQLDMKLPVTMQEATDTIHVIEHAMTRPKTQIDALMEQEDNAMTGMSTPVGRRVGLSH